MHSLFISLCIHPIPTLPGFTKPFQIKSDAYNAKDGVLIQEHAFLHKPITFLSKILTRSKKNYSFHNCELLAIVTCCKVWRPYINRQ